MFKYSQIYCIFLILYFWLNHYLQVSYRFFFQILLNQRSLTFLPTNSMVLLEIYQRYQLNVIGLNPLLLELIVQGLVTYIYTHVKVHYNTGYCTMLLQNKVVALRRFLREHRSTRLNHVTLMFLVFLFYTFPFASTLAYTTWYNISRH